MNSWSDLLGDSCGLSDCGSVGVLVVSDVLVSPFFRCGCGERSFVVGLRVEKLWNRSLFLSSESVKPFGWRIKET